MLLKAPLSQAQWERSNRLFSPSQARGVQRRGTPHRANARTGWRELERVRRKSGTRNWVTSRRIEHLAPDGFALLLIPCHHLPHTLFVPGDFMDDQQVSTSSPIGTGRRRHFVILLFSDDFRVDSLLLDGCKFYQPPLPTCCSFDLRACDRGRSMRLVALQSVDLVMDC